MAEPVTIKPEPEAEGASPMVMDEDVYEDNGDMDLEFYNTVDVNGVRAPEDQLLMARIPAYVWKALDKLAHVDDDTPIEIGKLRTWMEPDLKNKAGGGRSRRTRLLLKNNIPDFQGMPREYDLSSSHDEVDNTFVFTESDLEGFKNKNKMRRDAANQGIPSYLMRPKVEKPAQKDTGPGGRRGRKDAFRQVIPKKTAVAGRVKQEVSMNPIDIPETSYLMSVRAQDQVQPKQALHIVDRFAIQSSVVQAGTSLAHKTYDDFVKRKEVPNKKARAEAKTARMPENELLDRIFQAYQQYAYWGLKALRAQIPQPEQYLRQTLDKVAVMHKSGSFANNWSLKPEHLTPESAGSKTTAPQVAPEVEDDDDDDEEDVKMEDVPI